ncbi:MAG: amino acid permease [Bryobacteraceae bacterium]
MKELRRELGRWSAASIVVGTVIGSGIFLVPRDMALALGSPDWIFLVWVVGGLLSLSGALSYAELSAAMPGAGGEYVYLREAYGPFWSFTYGWTQMWVAKSGSIATLAAAFFDYYANFYPGIQGVAYTLPIPIGTGGAPLQIHYAQLLAVGLILLLGGVNFFGVRLGGNIQVAVTALKLGLIFFIIAAGLAAGAGSLANFGTSEASAAGGVAGFFAALVAALWAYDGWNNVTMVAGEVKEPQRNLPMALIWGTGAVMAIYLLANLAYFYVLSAPEVAGSPRVAAEMMNKILGRPGANAVSIAAMISIFAALNGSILSGSRVPYAMARDRFFFNAMSGVHPVYGTPAMAIFAMSAWAGVLVLTVGGYQQLFTSVIFASWVLYGMTTAGVIVLRRKRPDLPRPYRTLGYPVVPILFVIVAACLVVSTLIASPRESALGLIFIALGIPFYRHWRSRQP